MKNAIFLLPCFSGFACYCVSGDVSIPLDVSPAAMGELAKMQPATAAAVLSNWPAKTVAFRGIDGFIKMERTLALERAPDGSLKLAIKAAHSVDAEAIAAAVASAVGAIIRAGAVAAAPAGQQAPPEPAPVVNAPADAADLRSPFPRLKPARVDRPQPMKGTEYGVVRTGR